jgi:universal stress protein E
VESFKRILVGIDLDRCRTPEATSQEATAQLNLGTAIMLARVSNAELLIFTVFNRTEEEFNHVDTEDTSPVKHSWKEEANLVLEAFVASARSKGVKADKKIVLGEPHLEIRRETSQGRYDLAVVGTHEISELRRFFIGNTALKLLRDCPCPVWVCKQAMRRRPKILIATDLSLASQSALHHGLIAGRLLDSDIHVIHVVKFIDDPLGNGQLGQLGPETLHYHQDSLRTAEKAINEQLTSEIGTDRDFMEKCLVHVVGDVGDPAHCIEQFITTNEIDILVLGTAARHGVAGFVIGNTAESLLPKVNCSLLVAKQSASHVAVT